MKKLAANLLLTSLLCTLAACAGDGPPPNVEQPRRHFTDQAQKAYAEKEFYIYDPAEGTNKSIYTFNAKLDKYVLIPVVDAYTFVMPEFLRRGIHNFFLNIEEVTNFTNAVFQANPDKAGVTLSRFVINSTIGLAGTFDVATQWGLQRKPEDFGRTLGRWGVGPGAYVMLPALGPSNVRDTLGKIVDYATLYIIVPNSVQDNVGYDVVAYGLQPIDLRYSNKFRYYDSGSPFEYELVRYIVSSTREGGIEKLRHPEQNPPPANNVTMSNTPVPVAPTAPSPAIVTPITGAH